MMGCVGSACAWQVACARQSACARQGERRSIIFKKE